MRLAHDAGGRLKRVVTPDGCVRYTSPQWDRLLSSPTTWNLRFDGVGKDIHVAKAGPIESRGQNVVNHQYSQTQSQTKNAQKEDKAVSIVEVKNIANEETDIQQIIDKAVKEAVAAALAKEQARAPMLDAAKIVPTVVLTEVAADEA